MSGTVTLDLGGVEPWEAGGQILPPGKHTVRITEAELGTSSGGHPEFKVQFTSVGDSASGEIRDWIVCAPASMGKVRAFLEAAGVQIPEGAFQIRADQLSGKRLVIVVHEEQDFNDPSKKRSRVKGYAKLANQADVPIDTADFDAPATPAVDDDIPF